MTLQDLALLEESLFANYSSKGLDSTQSALQLALDRVTSKLATLDGADYTRAQLLAYKKMLTEEISGAYGGLYESMQDESVKTAEVVGNYMSIATKALPDKVINDLINSNRQIVGYGFKELFQAQSDNHVKALRVVLGTGVAQGMTAKQIVSELIDKNNSLSKGQLVTAVNSTIKSSRESARYARYKEYEAMGIIKGYMYDSTLDGRTSEICRSNSGRKFMVPLDEVPLDARPPLHMNCRSVLVQISTNDYKSGKKASMFGETKDESYPKWLSGLDEDKQRLVLGRKFDAYKRGTYKINSIADVRGVTSHNIKDIDDALNNKNNFK